MIMKTIILLNRFLTEHIDPPERSALISIRDPGQIVDTSKWQNVLPLEFYDIEPESVQYDALKYALNGFRIFDSDHAQTLLAFVSKIHNEIDYLFIHCEAGISRSPAVGLFLSEKYNLPLEWHGELYIKDGLHNKHVYTILTDTKEK